MTDNTQPRPSKEAMEEAEKVTKQIEAEWVEPIHPQWRLSFGPLIALALDQAKAEGAERVVRAVELARVYDTKSEVSARQLVNCISAARQALQEVKGERVC